ncbi:cupin domain-containing protein [Dyella psychrodurans]|uniref:Cupin domain-containing protein n=1 Tax=Dyella psychrodurans TaxID=1927960 RepID=A0A370XD08_9GAMM|nr:cupin domain-containing protein [Dyella psychrodurans]RDS86160.1 cupin domain-containing protein [Dyella psychrodurans]
MTTQITKTQTLPVGGVVDLQLAFESLTDYWSPKVVARVNDSYVKVAKLLGEFVWHDHAEEDELFYIVRGSLRIQYPDGKEVHLPAGTLHVVQRGTRHNPVADQECWIVLIEPVNTKHTGGEQTPLTRSIEEQLG